MCKICGPRHFRAAAATAVASTPISRSAVAAPSPRRRRAAAARLRGPPRGPWPTRRGATRIVARADGGALTPCVPGVIAAAIAATADLSAARGGRFHKVRGAC